MITDKWNYIHMVSMPTFANDNVILLAHFIGARTLRFILAC